ncbi:pilus assembly protein TadG-related protein [Sulfitobacter mediterraneus]|uniref:pilus assembly protein TadG-related protein n=1 Tax=Sulfitobacter mediterraneus TaxID=83219 RepID=UPI00248F9E0E|nr:TadE/TadG family type IV pilus assembly protein [Sulfitobacter mediterraneus]
MKPDMNQEMINAIMGHPRKFARDEEGTITIFAMFMVLMMVMIGGIGADMMRHEMERTRIQAVSDRAVLAAADLDQTLDPEAVVRDYFDKSGMAGYVSNVDVDEGLNYRTVTVDASMTMNTQFMDTMGVEELSVPARSRAQEKVNKVEISLVLDISGSMRHNSKMDNLHDAAGTFLDAVLKPENQDLISVSVIPYTAQVNAGPDIFGELNINSRHVYSHCVDFDSNDFDITALSLTESYTHMQHFEAGWYWNGSNSENSISNPGCPKRTFERITAFSQDKNALKAQINQFQPRANTAIHLGMKWGVAMLDPAFQPVTQNIGTVDGAFTNRPASYSDSDTLKTIILMTDGENVPTVRIKDSRYDSSSERYHWSRYPLYWWLNRSVKSSKHYRWRYTKYSSSQADSMLNNICDAAKDKHIVIWSIGFEVGNHGASVMEDCASSPSHFFRVEGVEISEAFAAIARQINQLRLTQ